MTFRKLSRLLIAPAIALFFFSCSTEDILPEPGTVEFSLAGTYFALDYPGALLLQDANGYTKKAKYTSVYRTISAENNTATHLRITGVDLDSLTFPADVSEHSRLTLYLNARQTFEGKDGDIKLTILSFKDDLLEAEFSGQLFRTDQAGQRYDLAGGKMRIYLTRF